ncbi:hypothetical protein K1T71_000866 [Dendrolimus kikuchii]|uniref:Uncharacterized protein n=1 Tax=Dendrolimus kikuchii TaxID=765133 RepID=A0ACC1DGF0_9NEOP|nr:hypothetical protein K1T71_000866 [Dendrolimus kikuchii]
MSYEGYTEAELEAMPDRIAESFTDQTILITGGTGFMGKVLLEKLLRKCPGIDHIYLLVRPKKGKTPQQRLEEIFSGPLFEMVRNMRGGIQPLLEKVSIIAGDAGEPGLALSPEDREKMINEVDIIIHAAATIRFDEELRKAVLLNVRGTKLLVELGKTCKKLKVFIHISTSYCHLNEKLLEEKPYPPPADPHQIIDTMEWMDEKTAIAVTPKLLNKLPNSYAFTKALGEALVVEAMDHGLPAMVLRPSIVIPIWRDPIPGWTDNINGPTGLLIGAGKGVLRTMYCKSNSYADYLPVDVFINGIMIAVWNYTVYGDKAANVVNFTSSAEIKVTWSELIDTGREIIMNKVPLNGVAWYPGGSMKHSRLHHNICAFFFHWVPAFIVDTLLFCLGYKPVLMRVQRRISKGFEVFEYYTNNQWDFKSDIAQTVRTRLNPRERRDYKVDSVGVDIMKYFEDCVRAARIYILKEYDDTLPAARRHMKVMWWVDLITRFVFWALMFYWMSGWMSSFYSYPVDSNETSTIMDPAQAFMNEVEKLQEPMNAVIERGNSPVQSWYKGSTIFITGGNGFLGKLLVEKLLRACNVKKIYLLLRGKKNKTMIERLDIMLQDPIFDRLKEKKPKELSKIVSVEGDVGDLHLGLRDSDWSTLAKEVDVIFHMAATTRFDESLRVATNVNVRGTREVLALARACKKLRLFNHISTAYTYATRENINGDVLEEFYKPPVAPHALIEMVETMADNRLNAITEKLIEGWPNTYSFTKAVAEELINEMKEDLPICVMRPSIVQGSYYEPAPGWMDKSVLFGAGGIKYGVGKGVLHVLYFNKNYRLSYVPGDYVANATIAAGWYTACRWKEDQKNIKIYTISSTKCNFAVSIISEVMNTTKVRSLHSPRALWYSFMLEPQSKITFLILTWLLHFIPAYILDGIFFMFRIKMPPGIKSFAATYEKIYKMNLALAYFLSHDWSLRDDNTEELCRALAPEDRAIFNCDVTDVDWRQYVATLCMGLRKYIEKDGLKDTEYGVKKQKWLKIANYVFFALYFYVIYKVLYSAYTLTMDPAQAFMNEVEKLQEPMNAVIERGNSPVQSWYKGSTIFITGGNGFLGKLLIEKLLRACNVKKIYILLRGKKNKTMIERLDIMLQDPIFDRLKETKPKELSKIVPVEGDVANLHLGLRDSDWSTLVKEVDVIFHMAATTRFDESIRVATNVNVRGTREALALARACEKLRLFNHVSTAYTYATRENINGDVLEEFYEPPVAPRALIEMVETMADNRLNAITEKLIEGWPNTYSFTKAVAEELIKEMKEDLPICVMRPSIVQGLYYEPAPGWMDSSVLFGAGGIKYGVGKGVIHVLYFKKNCKLSYVPGDYVTNATIAAGWYTACRWKGDQKNIKIYTISSTKCNFGISIMSEAMNSAKLRSLHSPRALWYTFMLEPRSKITFLILTWLLHFIPAYILDGIFFTFRITMPPGIKSFAATYEKIYKMNLSFAYFLSHDWSLRDDNTEELCRALAPEDRAIFNCDVTDVDWRQYVATLCMGLRKYIEKDGLQDTEYGVKKQKWLKIANYVFFALYFYAIYKVLYSAYTLVSYLLAWLH